MPKTTAKPEVNVEDAIERLHGRPRSLPVTSARRGGPRPKKAVDQLNQLYAAHKDAFTAENVRFANVLRGALGVRLDAHSKKVVHVKKAKRKGDKLDHCWRCATPVDERFTENCPKCSEKTYQWRICPVCNACGCQRAGKVLI